MLYEEYVTLKDTQCTEPVAALFTLITAAQLNNLIQLSHALMGCLLGQITLAAWLL